MAIKAELVWTIEKPEEKCTVVFALIVTELATECVCVCVWDWELLHTPLPPPPRHPTSLFRNNFYINDCPLFSRFLHGLDNGRRSIHTFLSDDILPTALVVIYVMIATLIKKKRKFSSYKRISTGIGCNVIYD